MTATMPKRIAELIDQSTKEFFQDNQVKELKSIKSNPPAIEYQWTSIIGVSGDLITGSLAVTCKEELLNHTHPNITMGMPVEAADRVDWLGEISNQILGRFKNYALEYGLNFFMSSPSVVKGQTLEVMGQGKKTVENYVFSADGHQFYITFVCTINPNFNIDTAVKVEKVKRASEGDSLLF